MNKYNHLSNTFKGRQGFQTFFKFMEKAIKHLFKKKKRMTISLKMVISLHIMDIP